MPSGNDTPDPGRSPESVELRELVDRLAEGTIALEYNDWNWGEGVAQYALLVAGLTTGNDRYVSAVTEFMRRNADFHPVRPEQIMPSLAAVLLHEHTGDPLPLTLAMRVADMLETYPRSQHGAYIASPVRSVWVDYIYETEPFLFHLSRITGDPRYEGWAIDQTLAYLMSCWNARDRLFHHVYYDAVSAPNPFYWARANGWTALGLIEMIELLPERYGLRPMLLRVLGQLCARLVECQGPTGFWHTVLLDTSSSPETSATARISLALSRAARAGWIDGAATAVADSSWAAVVSQIDQNGNVLNVSAETPPGDAEDYQAIPLGVYPWGQGFTLLAALDRLVNSE